MPSVFFLTERRVTSANHNGMKAQKGIVSGETVQGHGQKDNNIATQKEVNQDLHQKQVN